MDAPVKKRNTLTHNQIITLSDWLKANVESLGALRKTCAEAADIATGALKFVVTESHVRGIAGMAAGCPIKHEWPGYRPVRAAGDAKPSGTIEARLAAIEAKLDQVLRALPGPLFAGN